MGLALIVVLMILLIAYGCMPILYGWIDKPGTLYVRRVLPDSGPKPPSSSRPEEIDLTDTAPSRSGELADAQVKAIPSAQASTPPRPLFAMSAPQPATVRVLGDEQLGSVAIAEYRTSVMGSAQTDGQGSDSYGEYVNDYLGEDLDDDEYYELHPCYVNLDRPLDQHMALQEFHKPDFGTEAAPRSPQTSDAVYRRRRVLLGLVLATVVFAVSGILLTALWFLAGICASLIAMFVPLSRRAAEVERARVSYAFAEGSYDFQLGEEDDPYEALPHHYGEEYEDDEEDYSGEIAAQAQPGRTQSVARDSNVVRLRASDRVFVRSEVDERTGEHTMDFSKSASG